MLDTSALYRNRTLLAVSIAVCAAYTGIGMVVPVRILYAESRGASLAIISAMASAYLISNFMFQYPSGWLADRWGRRPVMMASLLFQAALSLAYLFITDPILFVALQFAEGIAGAAVLPSARALIADSVPVEKRGEAYGIFSAFFNTGFLLGPGIGGLLATTGYASAFIGAVLFRLLAMILIITMIRVEVKSNRMVQEQVKAAPPRKLFTPPLVGAYILAFGDYLYLGFDITLMPLWMHDHLGASVALIGLYYVAWAIPSIITAPIGGRIADRRRRSTMILIFGLAQVPFYIIYGLANVAIIIFGLFIIHSVIYSFIQPAVDAHLATSSPIDARARIQGMYTAAGLIGAFAASNGFSLLYVLNFRLPLFAIGASYGLCVLIGGILVRISKSRGLVSGPDIHNKKTEQEEIIIAGEQI